MEPRLVSDPRTQPAWDHLEQLAGTVGRMPIRELVKQRPALIAQACGVHVDLGFQRIDAAVMEALLDLAVEMGVAERRDAMLAGAHVNPTEERAVLHTALRLPRGVRLEVDGQHVGIDVHAVLDRMTGLAKAIRDGSWCGATGQRIRTLVNIGIGGSDLGPAMAAQALAPYADAALEARFVSNVDPADLAGALRGLDPASTLFLVASKTFTTAETMANAMVAREWVVSALGEQAVGRHFLAMSTAAERVREFGIDHESMLPFWDWVGGRYSMTSAIGFSTMCLIGPVRFGELLDGFHVMDRHFAEAPIEQNLPFLLGLVAVWNRTFLGIGTNAVLPYSQALARFPAYLQQLAMESNGKSVRVDGTPVDYETGAIVWGEPGTNGQHSFYQLLHQGTSDVACDIIVVARQAPELGEGAGERQRALVANALAQASVLALGRTAEEVAASGTPVALVPHAVMPGNRPTTVLMVRELDPRTLGSLIALYEHSVFVQGGVWGIDSFDQWGVELGKRVASRIIDALDGDEPSLASLDARTQASIARYRALSGPHD